MNTTFNPDIVTCNERPTQEAVKAAEMVSRYIYWMANRVSQKLLINAFGEMLGNHYWSKIVRNRENAGYQSMVDMLFWFELDTVNRQRLMHYLLRSGYRAKY